MWRCCFFKTCCKLKQRSVKDHLHHARAGGHVADDPSAFPRLLQATVFVELPLLRSRRTHLGVATCEVPTEMAVLLFFTSCSCEMSDSYLLHPKLTAYLTSFQLSRHRSQNDGVYLSELSSHARLSFTRR